jgi:hypothetical protein
MDFVVRAIDRETTRTVLWAVSGFALGLHLAAGLTQWVLDGAQIAVAPLL